MSETRPTYGKEPEPNGADESDWESIAKRTIELLEDCQRANRLLQQELAIARQLNETQAREIDALRRGE